MNENKNIKTYSLIGAICSIICGIYFFVHPFSYDATIISIYYMVLCVLPYIMIAVLLLLRKKTCDVAYSLGNLFISNFSPMALVSF